MLFEETLEQLSSRQATPRCRFVATFLFHHFLGPDDLAWLNDLNDEKLSTPEMRALVFVREVGAVDNTAYREINQTDTFNAGGHLRHLRDLGLLEKKGAGSKTYYIPTPRFQASLIENSYRDPGDYLPADTGLLSSVPGTSDLYFLKNGPNPKEKSSKI